MPLGAYPTPVELLPKELRLGSPLWVKRDDLTNATYGGNKVRKLERILEHLKQRDVRSIVTVGAAGSHHALATALFARDAGIRVTAVLVPQPSTAHVLDNLRVTASLARVVPVPSFAHAAAAVVDEVACGAFYIPPGGSTADSSLAYAAAAKELLAQVARGLLPPPEVVVVPLGSGGTAAGLAAGFAHVGARVRVVAVLVSEPRTWVVRRVRRLAKRALAAMSGDEGGLSLSIEEGYLGGGYGAPTGEAEAALKLGAEAGLTLDLTYTAKTFAAATRVDARGPVVFWNTLSSAPLAPLLERSQGELSAELRALLRT
jgi:1-aminocyclopropane-1-carboxylate deaminase/D-cysteine desulfhydrase-like pyridoxal-dependent ACC family enzyme